MQAGAHDFPAPTRGADLLHRGSNEGIRDDMRVLLLKTRGQPRIESILIAHGLSP
jgi:hypothetical protein